MPTKAPAKAGSFLFFAHGSVRFLFVWKHLGAIPIHRATKTGNGTGAVPYGMDLNVGDGVLDVPFAAMRRFFRCLWHRRAGRCPAPTGAFVSLRGSKNAAILESSLRDVGDLVRFAGVRRSFWRVLRNGHNRSLRGKWMTGRFCPPYGCPVGLLICELFFLFFS